MTTKAVPPPERARKIESAVAKPRGLTKRELSRMKRDCATAVRELIKHLSVSPHTSCGDMVAALDAIVDEVHVARKIITVIDGARPAKKKAVA